VCEEGSQSLKDWLPFLFEWSANNGQY